MVVPTDWREVHLSDIGTLRGGMGFPHRFQGGKLGIPFYKVSDMNTPGNEIEMQFANNYVTPDTLRSMAGGSQRAGSIIFAKVGAAVFLERKRILSTESCIDNNLMALTLDESIASVGFVHQALQRVRFSDMVSTTALPSLNGAVIGQLKVLLPPLDEQEVIAQALMDVDEAIKSLESLIAKKRDIKQATMQQLLTGRTRLPGFTDEWEEVQLADLGSTFGGLAGKSAKDFGEGQDNFITFMNVMTNVVLSADETEKVRIGFGEHQSQVLEGDIIFNGSSETPDEVGLGAVVPPELAGVYLNSFCFGFRKNNSAGLDSRFFAYLTRSSVGRSIIRPMAQGSTRYNIAKTVLLKGYFPLPTFSEQVAIADILSDSDSELLALSRQLSKMREIKHGMMQDLLTGKVRLT